MKTIDKVRKVIKELGYNSKQVSVRKRPGGYETSIHVTIKDLKIDSDQISEATRNLEEVSYCEASQEILAGGNTFINVSYDWEKKDAAVEALKPLAEKIDTFESGVFIHETPEYYIFLCKDNPHMPTFNLRHKTEDIFDNRDGLWHAHNAYHIAEALFHMNIKHKDLIPALEKLTEGIK